MAAPFSLHTTGHWRMPNGWLIRVDVMGGKWVACQLDPALQVRTQVKGTDEQVHLVACQWARIQQVD